MDWTKYDKSLPRYTSYPPVPRWSGRPVVNQWIEHIRQTFNENGPRLVDTYVHIPFCRRICTYCGCNRLEKSDHGDDGIYVDALIREWGFYQTHPELQGLAINHLHMGGGTPNFLEPDMIRFLINALGTFKSASIEIDPRTVKYAHLEKLHALGVGKISFGIQDFDPDVQKIIGRVQPYELVEKWTNEVKKFGFELNFDLVCGLPGQSIETIRTTCERILALNPDCLAFYNFAYVPQVASNQVRMDASRLPSIEEKWNIYFYVKSFLESNGYFSIGMDHFAKEGTQLAKAWREDRIERNFMGYGVRKSKTLIGLGVSSISQTPFSFVQNEKEFSSYISQVDENQYAFSKGHVLTEKESVVGAFIERIMCCREGFLIDGRIENYLTEMTKSELEIRLKQMQDDQLIEVNDCGTSGRYVRLLNHGRVFRRFIAHAFDELL